MTSDRTLGPVLWGTGYRWLLTKERAFRSKSLPADLAFTARNTKPTSYWELDRCLNDKASPVDPDAANNLRFLIGLRHEIEHQMTRALDTHLSGRYQACALNYNDHLKNLFGENHGLDKHLTYTIQFADLTTEQRHEPPKPTDIPSKI